MKIAAIGAHFDDIEIGAGGSLARFSEEGHTISALVACGRELIGGHDELKQRTKELMNASCCLGILSQVNIGVEEDGFVIDDAETVERFENVIRDADIVFTQHVHDTHQDHRAVAWAAISAARHVRTILMFEPVFPAGRGPVPFHPNFYIDISSTIEFKRSALRSYVSQMEKYGDAWIESLIARCKLHGFNMGVEYAEAFECVRTCM